MVTPIVMPKFGQMTEDSAIVEWLKKEGDTVAKGDVLFLVETDKSVMEVESFNAGTLLKIVVGVGVSVPVQSVVAYLGEKGEAVPATPAPARRRAAERAARREDRRAGCARRRADRSRARARCRARGAVSRRARALPHQPARGGARQGKRDRRARDRRQRARGPHRREGREGLSRGERLREPARQPSRQGAGGEGGPRSHRAAAPTMATSASKSPTSSARSPRSRRR